jgi:hypothetical protein
VTHQSAGNEAEPFVDHRKNGAVSSFLYFPSLSDQSFLIIAWAVQRRGVNAHHTCLSDHHGYHTSSRRSIALSINSAFCAFYAMFVAFMSLF